MIIARPLPQEVLAPQGRDWESLMRFELITETEERYLYSSEMVSAEWRYAHCRVED